MAQPVQLQFQVPPGQAPPTPEQIAQIQRQITEEAQKAGVSVQQYVEQLKAQAMRQQMQMQQQMQQGGGPPPNMTPQQAQAYAQAQQAHQQRMQQQQQQQQGQQQQQQGQQGQQQGQPPQQQQAPPQAQQIPLNGSNGPPKPEALAVAKFLKSQDLKPRTSLLGNERKDMFRVKRAIRALMSPAYQKARGKNPLLPDVNDRVTAENTFKMLPMSLLALRVSKVDPHEGHNHGKKRTKGLWTVKVEQHQEAHDDMYYVWLYEGPQWRTKLIAGGVLALILAVVFFPVWPYKLRLGVWYLSMAALGVLGLFFTMAIFRLILFIITMFTHPPGLWLYPNLFEDVGFFDSFRPVWAWQETKESKKAARVAKKAKKEARQQRKHGMEHTPGHVEEIEGSGEEDEAVENEAPEGEATGAEVAPQAGVTHHRNATVEEEEDDE